MKVGDRFGMLVVVSLSVHRAIVRCDCGREKDMFRSGLRPRTRSCGCKRGAFIASSNTVHGHTRKDGYRSPEYFSWEAMLTRCTRRASKDFARYGGRGITVCSHWRTFTNFLADMGPRPPGHSIERNDNAKGYEPGNCRWATAREQAANRRNTTRLTIDGVTRTQAEWARAAGLTCTGLSQRVQRGLTGAALLARSHPGSRNSFINDLDLVSR